jgi:RNA polymerase sigma-70 factor (ECF subfamily)
MLRRRFPALDAAEVYQRAALRALEHCEAVRDRDRVDAWVRRIVLNSALDALRERNRREIVTAEPPEVPVVSTVDETCTCTLALLTSLPASYADILRRVDVEGTSVEEVASTLELGKGNVAVRLHRARRALRDRLREHCGVETIHQCLACVCDERGCCSTA